MICYVIISFANRHVKRRKLLFSPILGTRNFQKISNKMLYNQVLGGVKQHVRGALCTRNIGILAPCLQKATDPIQQLFVDKLKEYSQKSAGGSKLVEPSPLIEKELKSELEKAAKQYGGGPGVDMTKFPSFKFTDPVIDPINEVKK